MPQNLTLLSNYLTFSPIDRKRALPSHYAPFMKESQYSGLSSLCVIHFSPGVKRQTGLTLKGEECLLHSKYLLWAPF